MRMGIKTTDLTHAIQFFPQFGRIFPKLFFTIGGKMSRRTETIFFYDITNSDLWIGKFILNMYRFLFEYPVIRGVIEILFKFLLNERKE